METIKEAVTELGRIFTGCEEYLKTNVLKRTYNKRKKK